MIKKWVVEYLVSTYVPTSLVFQFTFFTENLYFYIYEYISILGYIKLFIYISKLFMVKKNKKK